jgi:hypothetical protein
MSALALRKIAVEHAVATTSDRDRILAQYRHLREIGKRHHSGAMEFLSRDSIPMHAKRIGITVEGRRLFLDNEDELDFVFDLAIHTAQGAKSRAIDRYARCAKFELRSDAAVMLDAMREARFAILCVKGRHATAGLVVTDFIRKAEHWLMDEGLEISLPDGAIFATRLFTPGPFSMTSGVIVPLHEDLIEEVMLAWPHFGEKSVVEALDDRRLAEAIYRIAFADGILERVQLLDTSRVANRAGTIVPRANHQAKMM